MLTVYLLLNVQSSKSFYMWLLSKDLTKQREKKRNRGEDVTMKKADQKGNEKHAHNAEARHL